MVVLLGFLLAGVATAADPHAFEPAIPAVLAEFDRVCSRPLWPGFEPCRTPLVIFDGRKTWLVRHPDPPPEFSAAGERPEARLFEGRHPSVHANTFVDVAGTPTASAILEGKIGNPRGLAALLIHETFHVFQGERHAGWGANEADLFVYPVEDARALALRRLESIALRRALAAGHGQGRAAWAAAALEVRRERFARLPAAASGYERGTEMKEGLARYVQWLAGGSEPLFPETEFPPAAVRDRAYSSGAAMALLLDGLDQGWKSTLEEKDSQRLEDLLASAAAGAKAKRFSDKEVARENRRAGAEVTAADAERSRKRREFLEGSGWRLVVEPKEALQARGFDPLNLERLTLSEVLHTRFVKLANTAGSIEVLGRRCLTESAGRHPLFEGVSRVTIELPGPPRVEQDSGTIRISGDGLTVDYRGVLTSRGQVYILR
jgi:hypothetical protein